MANLKQSTVHNRAFLMVQSADHISGLTGATVTVKLSKNGGTGAAAGGTVTEIDSTNVPGWYNIALTTTDTGTVGDLAFHCTATSGDPTDFVDQVTANVLGDTLPASVLQWNGTNVAGSIPPDVIFIRSGTAQAGASSSITLDSGASATNSLYNNCVIFIRSGTGAGQSQIISAYNGSTKVATIAGTWATTPDSTSVFTIAAFGPVQATVSGTVNANVIQWLGASVTADSGGLPQVTVGTGIKTNTALNGFQFVMTDSTNHNPLAGLGTGITAQRSINGGAFASCTNTPTEISNGLYTINLSASDLNGKTIDLRFSDTGADDLNILLITTP